MAQATHPKAAKVIQNDFYVDDLLTGAGCVEDLQSLRDEVSQVLQEAGFELAKWFSNCPELSASDSAVMPLMADSDVTKTLGVVWLPVKDYFQFRLDDSFLDLRATKRNILSVTARLFDPLGLLCPLVTKAKMLLQELWLRKLDWDESLPMQLLTSWETFKATLLQLPKIKVSRFVNTDPQVPIQIHGFADASMRAYGACIYIRTQTAEGLKVSLLTAKSKVAPLKTKTLPRLELCAAHLLADLYNRVRPLLNSPIENVFLWTDSEITLHWIKTHPSSLSVFVSNRVAEIQEWSEKAIWRHVPTKVNPADIVSRGCDVEELTTSIWFGGPSFLLDSENNWPVNKHFELPADVMSMELRKSAIALVVSPEPNYVLQKIESFSSHLKLLRVFVWVFRFIQRCRKVSKPFEKSISPRELDFAFDKIVEVVQFHEFRDDISKIRKNKPVATNIQKLNPFLQENKSDWCHSTLLRVGGRLLNAPIPYEAKFPLLLSKSSQFVRSYVSYLHVTNCHAGPRALVSRLREKIWLVNAQEVCRRTVRSCMRCFRCKPQLLTQIMGNLPADRLRALRPFNICGVDFCGPFSTTYRIRGKPPYKSYVALFVCFASKAVHLELVSDLTTDAFLLAFQRFVSRRGIPEKV
ncbi:uncharacterized protein LOC128263903 [Drosophila gunungcola]|uniref:uncharacterized protein LOC128263903 n=1 Tax=Drosophila gunungcola TaxID=103775 RepID=UPI0022E3F465|nr:uncharacterized protein LOC128263903 [Drosophila gunungcola]